MHCLCLCDLTCFDLYKLGIWITALHQEKLCETIQLYCMYLKLSIMSGTLFPPFKEHLVGDMLRCQNAMITQGVVLSNLDA